MKKADTLDLSVMDDPVEGVLLRDYVSNIWGNL